MAAVLVVNQNQFRWTTNAAIQLIRERRGLHEQFERVPHNRQANLWTMVSNRLQAAMGFVVTPDQCKNK
jgi:Myb/SANT-like DNA-binding domain